ncbi:MAG: DNA polymerase I, partial [Anaerolineae bacterium]|nr:DNA polymerase I [Anaerolineae bacterium]
MMSDANNRPTLIMIDGHALAYRQYFALPVEAFSTADGEPTNAVYGFARTLLDVLEKDRPKYLLVTFDKGLSGRDEQYAEYKGTREKMPDDMRIQMQRIYELVQAFNIPILELDGYEADDVMGTLAQQAEAEALHTLIVTGDRDLLQLVTDLTHVRLPPGRWNKTDQVFDPAAFREKYQLEPPQLV